MNKHKILVVDDEIAIQDFINNLLVQENYVVETCDGNGALKIAQSFQPDLVLLDVMMPAINGIEISNKLKSNPVTKNIPVILMSGSRGLIEAPERSNQVEGTLEKPFTIESLLECINRFFDTRQKKKTA
ncbi:MAG TPA: response regulator [Chloroflexia bacterium]|nr:response regulator [Chloroflexia bacterium]